jgi:hypothetical protein
VGKSNKYFDRGEKFDKFDRKVEHKSNRQMTRNLLKSLSHGQIVEEEDFEQIDKNYKSGKFAEFYENE